MKQDQMDQELLKKYVLNECTTEEVEQVITYFQNMTSSDAIPSVEEVLLVLKANRKMESVNSNTSFDSVLAAAKEKEHRTVFSNNNGKTWRRIASVAAIFVGLFSLAYFFWQKPATQNSVDIPEDAITLEFEDGSIEILLEDSAKKIVNKVGKVLGQQQGGQISYEHSGIAKELVYNTLTVPYGKRFELKLSDGTSVHLNAGTSLKYPVKFIDGQSRKVFLTGEAFFGVSKDTLHPFVVNTAMMDVRVLGTQFNVSSYNEDQNTDVVLVEGSVAMYGTSSNFNDKTSIILEPGLKGTFEKESGNIKTEHVVTDIYTAWTNGELAYRNMTFKNILKKLERHYDVVITNNDNRLADEVFNASYGEISLHKVLEDLKLTYGINYMINGTNITIN